MKRLRFPVNLFAVLVLSTLSLFAKESYDPCFQKNSQSIHTIAGVNCLAVSKHSLICHDPRNKIPEFPSGYSIDGYDPFTRTYKVSAAETFLPVRFKPLGDIPTGKAIALVGKKGYDVGKVLSYANGFDRFGQFSLKDTEGKVLGVKCYSVVGIGSLNGSYISSEFIQKLMDSPEPKYGDIGIRMERQNNRYIVVKRDVYFPDNPFQVGDEILRINGRKYARFDALNNAILFAKQGEVLEVEIRRDGIRKTLQVPVGERYGGGYMADTFLERFGLSFDENLRVVFVAAGSFAHKRGLVVGDRILQIDGKKVVSVEELARHISTKELSYSSILMDRNDFYFFFTIP